MGLIDERSYQLPDYVAQIEIPGLELFRVGEGEKEVYRGKRPSFAISKGGSVARDAAYRGLKLKASYGDNLGVKALQRVESKLRHL